ncbi:MAG: hypothetical protein O2955_12090 [Planctomycetota bacterium]|nr:hypothetical protein [Planctomycetota bacterium]MDA1213251.1 hypothetical protein [Planctomycetota bacterium]
MYSSREVLPLLLIIIGVIWCVEIIKRRDEDWETLKCSREPTDKWIIIGFWIATVTIAYFLATLGVSYVVRISRILIDLARW